MTDDHGDQPSEPGGGQSGAFFATGAARTGRAAADLASESARAAAGEDGPRRCGFSYCRKPLPAAATGRRRDYCRPEDTAWQVEGRDWTCAELGRGEQALRAVTGQAAAADVDAVALGERIDAVLGPVQGLLGPVTALTGALGGVREQLDGAVTFAREETARALRKAAEADGRAETERQNAAEATATAKKAQEKADTAARLAAVDRQEKEAARTAEAVAVGQVTELKKRLEAAEERMTGVLKRNETLGADLTKAKSALAKATADLAATQDTLTAAQAALAEEKQRAAAAAGRATDLEAEVRRLNTELDTGLTELRTSQQAALEEARAAYDRRVAEAADAAAAAAQRQLREFTRDLGELNRANGLLTGKAETAETRARDAEQAHARLRERLAAAADALGDPGGTVDADDVRQSLRALLDASGPETGDQPG